MGKCKFCKIIQNNENWVCICKLDERKCDNKCVEHIERGM